MKLAVKKEPGIIPLTGFHYMLAPIRFTNDREPELWRAMGYIIVEVSDELGERLLQEAGNALSHQVEVARLTEHALLK